MQKLASQELLPESQQSEYVRTHPLTRDRIDFLENAAQKQRGAPALPAGWAEKHARMKAKLFGYLFPERMADATGDSIAQRYGRSIALYRRGRTAEALAGIDALIAAEPENPWFHELKAQILFETGRIADSLAPFDRAVTLAPQAGLIRAAYGHALLEAPGKTPARRQAAIAQLQAALRTEPRMARIHRLLATAYGQEGKEGFSRLHLAEEALIRNNTSHARQEALLAQKALPRNSAAWLRAEDILAEIRKKGQKDKK